jgi:hypothetical protein
VSHGAFPATCARPASRMHFHEAYNSCSFYSAYADVLAAGSCFADALQVLFSLHPGAVHVFLYVSNTSLGGNKCCEHSALFTRSYVDVPNSY